MWRTARRATIATGAAAALLASIASTSAAAATTPRKAHPPSTRPKAHSPSTRGKAHRPSTRHKVDPQSSKAVNLPLQGTFDGTGCGVPENIDPTGTVHIIVHANMKKDELNGVTSLSSATGTGEITGAAYQLTDSDSFHGTVTPGQNTRITFSPSFLITPPGLAPSSCQFVAETVDIGADGSISGITASTFSPNTGD
jgi:hypothetical protein